jgi:beta-phosphoglucomutase-like phosphatase (HAD superfamily)
MTLGFSNVLVGVSFSAMLRCIAVSAAQNAIQAGVAAGVDRASRNTGRTQCG